MDKSVRGFHEATWEFFTTERSYVLLLKLAVDVYLAVLLDLQQKGILNEVDIEILLENIKELIDHIRHLFHLSGQMHLDGLEYLSIGKRKSTGFTLSYGKINFIQF